jgi:hypothetical protein
MWNLRSAAHCEFATHRFFALRADQLAAQSRFEKNFGLLLKMRSGRKIRFGRIFSVSILILCLA